MQMKLASQTSTVNSFCREHHSVCWQIDKINSQRTMFRKRKTFKCLGLSTTKVTFRPEFILSEFMLQMIISSQMKRISSGEHVIFCLWRNTIYRCSVVCYYDCSMFVWRSMLGSSARNPQCVCLSFNKSINHNAYSFEIMKIIQIRGKRENAHKCARYSFHKINMDIFHSDY